jgi:hypothetical protein
MKYLPAAGDEIEKRPDPEPGRFWTHPVSH